MCVGLDDLAASICQALRVHFGEQRTDTLKRLVDLKAAAMALLGVTPLLIYLCHLADGDKGVMKGHDEGDALCEAPPGWVPASLRVGARLHVEVHVRQLADPRPLNPPPASLRVPRAGGDSPRTQPNATESLWDGALTS